MGGGVIYVPEKSADLSAWGLTTAAPVISPVNAEWERVVIEDPAGTDTTERVFGHVKVSAQ